MIALRSLIASTLLAAASALPAFAGYVGPDSVTYNYKIINWFFRDFYEHTDNDVVGGVTQATSPLTDYTVISGAVILGPAGLEDYSASKETVFISGYTDLINSWSEKYSYRTHTKYTPTATTFRERWYDTYSGVTAPSPTVSGGSLGVSYPTTVTGTTTSGTGFITVVSPDPDPIVGSPGYYVDYIDASNYRIRYETSGVQLWTVITWCDPTPSAPTAPSDPDWADPEFEDEE